MIKREGRKFLLYSLDGNTVIARYDSYDQALRQQRILQKIRQRKEQQQ